MTWRRILQTSTHERSTWFFEDSYPHSWSLAEAEGAYRSRIRLERKHSGIGERFYRPEHRFKGGAPPRQPFAFLLQVRIENCVDDLPRIFAFDES